MVDPQSPAGSTVLTATPEPPKTPESVLFKAPAPPSGDPPAAPPGEPPPVAPAAPPPATPPAAPPAPSEPPKPPTEPEKPAGSPPPAPAPTEYVLTLPPDSPLSADDLAAVAKEAKDAGMPKEKAEALLTSRNELAKASQARLIETQQKAFQEVQGQWKEAIAKDPEMGGEKLAETTMLASRAFKSVASAELQVWAEKTGLGNYPEFVRMMAKVGRLMGEDRLVRGPVDEPPAKLSPEERLYGKTTPK